MTAPELLAQLETVTHHERMRRMVTLGREARTNAGTQQLLATLGAGNFYERYLTLVSCFGSGDSAPVLRSLSEPSRILRGLARRMAATLCTDSEVQTALPTLPLKEQVALIRHLLRRKRRTPIDAFLGDFAESVLTSPEAGTTDKATQLSRLLTFASDDIVRRYLERLVAHFGTDDWTRFASFHPDLAAQILGEQARALTQPDYRVRYFANAVLPSIAWKQPDKALTLVEALLRVEPPSALDLTELAVRRPQEVADLLVRFGDGAVRLTLDHQVSGLSEEQLLTLLQIWPAAFSRRHDWLKRLKPATRRAVYAVAGRGWQYTDGVLDVQTVALLPGDLRVAEARRCLALPALATRSTEQLPYAAFLPWDEARDLLSASIRSPDADVRAVALSAFIGAARYDGTRLADALALVRARKNEQDPLRRALIAALAALPPSRWQTEHLGDLAQILQDALAAADLSPATASELEKLVLRLVPFHPAWAATQLALLVQARGQTYADWENRLTEAQARTLAPALLPVLTAWESRERESQLVQVASRLGTRLKVFVELAPILERLAQNTRNRFVAVSSLNLLAKHFPKRFAVFVPALLQRDPSAGTLPSLYQHLHRTRQDLLTPYLGQTAFTGRFETGKTRWVLPVGDGFSRWTPSQQNLWATTLSQIAADQSRDVPAVIGAVNRLALLPALGPERLLPLASTAETRTAVRDAALRALAHLDAGQGIPTLTDALGDERARIAIYALRAAIFDMPAPSALDLLRQVPTTRVTVAKEVVRLLGELKTPDAFPLLLEKARQTDPPLHRDIRIAVLRGLWDHLEQSETWDLFDQAASDTDRAIAQAVVPIPADRLSVQAQDRLRNLLAHLLEHPDVLVRVATLQRLSSLPLSDAPRRLLPRLLDLLASPFPDESRAAASAVFGTYTGADTATVGDAIARLRSDRRALQRAMEALHSAVLQNRTALQPTVRAVLTALEPDPLTVTLRINAALFGLPPTESVALLEQLAATGQLHADALHAALQAIGSWRDRGGTSTVEPLQLIESQLAVNAEPSLRRIALAALVRQSTKTPGWTTDLRARLETYRADPAPLVAESAQFTCPPPDTDTILT